MILFKHVGELILRELLSPEIVVREEKEIFKHFDTQFVFEKNEIEMVK